MSRLICKIKNALNSKSSIIASLKYCMYMVFDKIITKAGHIHTFYKFMSVEHQPKHLPKVEVVWRTRRVVCPVPVWPCSTDQCLVKTVKEPKRARKKMHNILPMIQSSSILAVFILIKQGSLDWCCGLISLLIQESNKDLGRSIYHTQSTVNTNPTCL